MEPIFFELPGNWPRVVPLLQKLIDRLPRTGMTIEALARDIQTGRKRVWIWNDFEAILLTTIAQQQNGRLYCSLSWAAGAGFLDCGDDLLPPIEEYAKTQGCFAVEIMGRKGWERLTKPYGYDFLFQSVMKEI